MADALPLQNKLALTAPTIQATAKVETFATDSYEVRAQIGINAVDQKVSVEWMGLTAAESRTVANFLDAHIIELIAFTPPPFTNERYFTCSGYNIATVHTNAARATYQITAELRRQFDPLS